MMVSSVIMVLMMIMVMAAIFPERRDALGFLF